MRLKKIAIIGCGVGGACAALELAKYGFNISIFESNSQILNRTSAHTPGRLGLGFHYPGDYSLETAKNIIAAAIEFKHQYPTAVLMSQVRSCHYLKNGWYFITKDSQTFPDDFLNYCVKIRDIYHELSSITNTECFGPSENYFRILDTKEFDHLVDKDNISFGIETQEGIINWLVMSNQIKNKLEKNENINIFTNHRVLSLQQQTNLYKLSIEINGQKPMDEEFEVVINASNDYRNFLDHQFGFTEQVNWFNRLKFLVKIRLPIEMSQYHSMFFARGPFAMFTNVGEGVGYCTYGPATNREQLNAINCIPHEWESYILKGLAEKQELEIGNEILAGVSKYIPHIKTAKLIKVIAGVVQHQGYANIYDSNSEMHVRNKTGIYNFKPGYYSLDTGKLSFAPFYGKEICKNILDYLAT